MDSVAVLGFSTPLPASAGKDLTRVAKRLARSGALVAARYDVTSGELVFLSLPERISIPDRGRKGSGREHVLHPRRPVYRRRKDERCWSGSVRVAKGGRWSGRIEVPAGGDAAALLTLERKGKGATLLPSDAALVIPEGEAGAVLALLDGLLARARRG
jgi:hypothetical protein